MKRALSRKNIWDAMPHRIRATLGRALGFFSPAWLLGRKFRSILKFVRDAQWWSAEQAREYQLRRLREVLALACEKTAFYRDSFDSVGFKPGDLHSLEDMRGLPTIDKHTVVKHLQDMCTISPDSLGVDYISTGGTSGQPLRFYAPASRSSTEYAYLVASWQRAGYKLETPMAVFRGRVVAPDRNGLRHEYDPLLRHHYYSNFHMNEENMRCYLSHLATVGPCFLHVYPSSVTCLAKLIEHHGIEIGGDVLGILAGSENLYQDQRELAERVLGARVLSWYGHSEKLVLASECEHSSDYHVWPTYGHLELLDDEGVPIATPGQRGEIVGTGFINTIVPFIRYRTGDYATYVGSKCEACGREHVILRDLEGRWPQGDLIASDGSPLSMTTLNIHDDTFENVNNYQFCQSSIGKAKLCIVPHRPLSDEEQRRILNSMNKRLQGQVVLELEIRSSLHQTAMGKQPRVLNTMKNDCCD